MRDQKVKFCRSAINPVSIDYSDQFRKVYYLLDNNKYFNIQTYNFHNKQTQTVNLEGGPSSANSSPRRQHPLTTQMLRHFYKRDFVPSMHKRTLHHSNRGKVGLPVTESHFHKTILDLKPVLRTHRFQHNRILSEFGATLAGKKRVMKKNVWINRVFQNPGFACLETDPNFDFVVMFHPLRRVFSVYK